MSKDKQDQIWKALSDPTRREILDFLRNGPKTTTSVVEHFPDLSRFNVMKHLEVLVGEEVFRQGLREYLDANRYGNASWPDLIAVLDQISEVIRSRFRFFRKVKTLSAEGRMSAWILR